MTDITTGESYLGTEQVSSVLDQKRWGDLIVIASSSLAANSGKEWRMAA